MNKPAAVGSLIILGVAVFVAGRYSSRPNSDHQSTSRRVLYYVDPMHPSYHSDKPGIAPDCGMTLEPVYEGEDLSVKLAPGAVYIGSEKQQLIGLRVETVAANSGSRLIRTTGRVEADDNRVYRLTSATEGRVTSLGNNPAGTIVKKNELLATFYSREFRNAEQAYLGSLTSVERVRNTREPDDQAKTTDANLRINEEQLRALGMGDPQIKDLARTRQITRDIEITSPTDGIVLARNISPEQRFEGRTEFYRVADLSKVWILADLFGDEGTALRPGTRVKITVRELPRTLYATVSQNPPLFDPESRTLKLRLEADNPGFLLRPDMFVDVEFDGKAPAGLTVPAEAVLDSGTQKIVYVESSEGVFEPKPVVIGAAYGDRIAVKRGLSGGDRVVTSGNFLIDSESRMKTTTLRVINEKSKNGTAMVKDPVCGMPFDRKQADASGRSETYHGQTFMFCSDQCRKKFQENPAKYAEENVSSASGNRPRHGDD